MRTMNVLERRRGGSGDCLEEGEEGGSRSEVELFEVAIV